MTTFLVVVTLFALCFCLFEFDCFNLHYCCSPTVYRLTSVGDYSGGRSGHGLLPTRSAAGAVYVIAICIIIYIVYLLFLIYYYHITQLKVHNLQHNY